MKVSVILPVRDGAALLREAIESVLEQDAPATVELIVIDDASTDASTAIARSADPGAIVLATAGRGPAGARNAGLRAATGAVIGFIDHDDLWPPGKLAGQLALLADPTVDVAGGPTAVAWQSDPACPIAHIHAHGTTRVLYNLGAYLMRRRVFERVGLLDESLRYAEDADLFLRIREAGLTIALSDAPGLVYRIHGANMTCGRRGTDLGLAAAVRRALRRRDAGDDGAHRGMDADPSCGRPMPSNRRRPS